MDLYYKQEVKVGLLVIVAASIFIGGLMWLSGRSFGGGGRAEADVVVTDASGLATGDPVQLLGRVVVSFEVPNRWQPHADAAARITSLDFLGAKAIAYSPGTAQQMLEEGQIIIGTVEAGILDGAAGITDQVASTLTGLQGFLSPEMSQQFLATFQAAERALTTIETVGDGPTIAKAREALDGFAVVALRLDTLLASPGLDSSITGMEEVISGVRDMTGELTNLTETLGSIMTKIDSAQGTIGMAINDSTLHNDMHDLLVSMRELLDDMRERPTRYFRLTVF
jgi:phospholipid/cholesterol/gamma-HCH transport system substrate-binding protein